MTDILDRIEEYDPEIGEAWDLDVHCEVCKHVHEAEIECTPEEPNLPIGRSCGNAVCCPTDECQAVFQVYGPHPGCAEFMAAPDEMPCGEKATVRLSYRDHRYEALTGQDGHGEMQWCPTHAEEERQDPGEGVEILREIALTEGGTDA